MKLRLLSSIFTLVAFQILGQPLAQTYRYTVDTPAGEGLVTLDSPEALPASLTLVTPAITAGVSQDIVLELTAGQRSPMAVVEIDIPPCVDVTPDNVTVNLIGRGDVSVRRFGEMSIGRTGTNYSYTTLGKAEIIDCGDAGHTLRLSDIDLRPLNGCDIRLTIKGVVHTHDDSCTFKARYTTSEPGVYHSPDAEAQLFVTSTVSDFRRLPLCRSGFNGNLDYTWVSFGWTPVGEYSDIEPQCTLDNGKTWRTLPKNMVSSDANGQLNISRLELGHLYGFRLNVKNGPAKGPSNVAWVYTGEFIAQGGSDDDTQALNHLIDKVSKLGGGVIRFPVGEYKVKTVVLQSNVWLILDSGAVISAIEGGDEPEPTWFSDRAYRSGLSPTDHRPYDDPENYLTKQDVGHTFFQNAMFRGERISNVKIIGTGRITGAGVLATSDKVMNNAPGLRCDKMFSFKLCENIEIGGVDISRDLWYDEDKDAPYYIMKDGTRDYDCANMLHIDRGGHFVVLATGCDGLNMHDTYFAKDDTRNVRDIYDFMGCRDVKTTNIYSRVSSDDIVKLGSDCSLGFTRPSVEFYVRNIIGDTNCNLFQIGSETSDDITDVYVDNIYVLGANKAGFSISTNDGANVRRVYLNKGVTGPIHSRSVMKRTRAPFFFSISNRGRNLGADAEMFTFKEGDNTRSELLITNSSIGSIEDIYIEGVDICEVYGGSSFRGDRWKPYDGTQNEAPIIVAGYKSPESENVEGGITFTLPDGRSTGYIKDITFKDVHLTVKGGHDKADASALPPEIGVGRYNVGDLKTLPAHGFYLRHVDGVKISDCTVTTEQKDGRRAVVMDDVINADVTIDRTPKMTWGRNNPIGTPKGINPGRVVWSHARGAATWDGVNGRWYEDEYNDQEKISAMVDDMLTSLTDQDDASKAWDALFRYFNMTHGKGNKGYKKGQKIAIKLNLNNTDDYADNEQLNASPHLTLALLRSLVHDAGVPQRCINVFDASRFMTDVLFNKCYAEFPEVNYVDNEGTNGRKKAEYRLNAIPYSVDNGKLATGLATCATDADYLINVALLKGHVGQGVTLCAKNWYGTTNIDRNFRKNQHNNFNQDRSGRIKYMTFTDFMGHKDLGGKTMLFLIDGLYGSKGVNGAPSGKWQMEPFCNSWPCSLFASQDPVAIDAVGLDFLVSEFPDMPDVDYCDMYLVEGAMADAPLSGTVYDPERDGKPMQSLGVFEHWNNPRDKQYTRNLGTAEGIELIYKAVD